MYLLIIVKMDPAVFSAARDTTASLRVLTAKLSRNGVLRGPGMNVYVRGLSGSVEIDQTEKKT